MQRRDTIENYGYIQEIGDVTKDVFTTAGRAREMTERARSTDAGGGPKKKNTEWSRWRGILWLLNECLQACRACGRLLAGCLVEVRDTEIDREGLT